MKEFSTTFKSLNKGLRPFENMPINNDYLVECYNLEPGKVGLSIHEALTSLNADGVSWDGEGQKAAASTTRTITIYVKDYVDETDLATVSVYLDGVLKGTTDANGELDITGIAVGGHVLKLTKTAYSDSDVDDLYNDYIMVI